MQVGTGKSVLNGIAIGKLKIYKKKDTTISTTPVTDTGAELLRFEDAQQKAIQQQTALYEKALAEAGEDIAEVFNIHAMMLEDDDFVDAIREIITKQKMCAEYAVKTAGTNQAAVFAAMDDPYLQARSADVMDIAQAMLDILQGTDVDSMQGTEPSILVAEDLAPSETVRLDKSLLLGFVTREGSANSHTAILARSMNIPALIQCKEISDDWDGKMAVIDGYNACVYVEPTPDLLKTLQKRQQEDKKKLALLQELKGKPNTTLDGTTINVYANIGGIGDVGAVQQNDAGGVGLFRSEFVYLNSKDYPTEEYQFEAYKQVVETLAPKKVIIRTCDIGADKTVDYMKLDHEENPALGYRAIRICLTRKDFFKTQLRALLRASAYGNLGIMFPHVPHDHQPAGAPRRQEHPGRVPGGAGRRGQEDGRGGGRHHDRDPRRRPGGRRPGRRVRFLLHRHQRPDPVHLRAGPPERQAGALCQPPPPRRAARDQDDHRRRPPAWHLGGHLRRAGR